MYEEGHARYTFAKLYTALHPATPDTDAPHMNPLHIISDCYNTLTF
jgi:hypothetical protein